MKGGAGLKNSPSPQGGDGDEVELLEHEVAVFGDSSRPHLRRSRRLLLGVFVCAFGLSLAVVLPAHRLINPGGWLLVRKFAGAALHPDVSADFLAVTWDATLTTIAFGVLGTSLSVLIGLVFGVLASETWWRTQSLARQPTGPAWKLTRGLLALPRGIHEAVWALLLVNILGLDPLVGILAIAIPFGAITAKVFSEILDEAAMGPFKALRALGVGRLKAFAYALGPQSAGDLISYSFYRFECAIRAAAILGVIGAGGLGFQIALSFQSLQYREIWTLIFALVIVSGLADLWSDAVRKRRRLFSTSLATNGETKLKRDRFLTFSIAGMVVLIVVSAIHLRLDFSGLWEQRARSQSRHLASQALPIDLGPEEWRTLGSAVLATLAMAIVASTLAWTGALGAAFLAAGRRPGSTRIAIWTPQVFRLVLLFCRAIPAPVWALLFVFVIFPGSLPGALALAVYNFGVLGRLMAEVVDNADDKPVTALRTLGVSGPRAFLYSVAPLTIPRFASLGLYRWEVTIREVVVVGLVGAGGLGRLLGEQLAAFDYSSAVVTVSALVGLTLLADLAGGYARRALR